MDILEITLGQIPEALYFALFMIFTNEIKTKRVCFIASTILEYVLLLNAFPYDIWSHILFIITLFLIMKIFYKDKCQVTDIFTLGISSLILIVDSIIIYLLTWFTVNNFLIGVILQKISMFVILFCIRKKLPNLRKLYYKMWNRNDKIKKIMKSTTFRSVNLVIFNFMFYFINICMILSYTLNGGV